MAAIYREGVNITVAVHYIKELCSRPLVHINTMLVGGKASHNYSIIICMRKRGIRYCVCVCVCR